MRNKIEILRSICINAQDMKTITNLGDSVSQLEIDFMIEFKKIYEFGLDQLKVFLKKLEDEGKDLDEYSIQYYVDVLLNGPLGSYVKEYTKDSKYFTLSPEIMGRNGNRSKASVNTPLYEDLDIPLGTTVDVYNKLPGFSQTLIQKSVDQTEKVFRSGLKFSMTYDNTLPVIDKAQQQRYNDEPKGKWQLAPNGTYLVKDKYFYLAVDSVSEEIFQNVKEYLGDENFRLWADKKTYSPFDSTKNTSTATVNKIEKTFTEGSDSIVITLDLLGDTFESEAERKAELKVSTDGKSKSYVLNSNIGQLSN